MPQETNLNVSPYFDDFDKDNNFYKVLFKPGTPVQARELSTLQSILQNQVEQFGTHFFKEGSKVIPGNLSYDNNYQCIELEDTFLGIPVELYQDQLQGLRITGLRSGVTATVRRVLSANDSERGSITLYVKYEKSSDDFVTEKFFDGESLTTDKDIVYGLSVIAAGESFANTIAFGATSTGSAMSVGDGVYFVRGTFVQVQKQTLILDQYSALPSYRIGFNVAEEFVTADEDPSLNDNASGFTNFAAPGADRLKISISLAKKVLTDTQDQNFVEIARVEEGVLQTFQKDTQYNLITDTLAKRTYDESGDYYVKPFQLFAKESLNDQIGNKGVFLPTQKTQDGGTPSDDLMLMKISPGKAYVRGYSIETISPQYLDVEKPRTTKNIEQESVSYSTGDPLFVNNIFGSPSLGIGTTATVSLLSGRRSDSAGTLSSGSEEIGLARLYDFKAQSASFVNSATTYETRMFDIKTFTKVTVGTAITSVIASDHIQGARSGATGFVVTGGNNLTELTLIDAAGKFLKDETILVNGNANGRVITKVVDFNFNDVKSLRSAVGVSTFEADVEIDQARQLGNLSTGSFQLVSTSGNTGKITVAGQNFAGIVTSGNILSYSVLGNTVPTFNRITGVATDGSFVNVAGVSTVSGVCEGGVPSGTTTLNDVLLRSTTFDLGSNSLLTPVTHKNLESLDVTTTTVQFRKQYSNINVVNNSFTSPSAGSNLFFQPFDEERYFISYDDGSVEPLEASQVTISADKKNVSFVGLSKASGKANLFATVLKGTVRNKQKNLNTANTLIVNRSRLDASGIGTNTLNDGLTFSRVFGTRVQDRRISLNVPDVVDVIGIFESDDATDPDLPSLTLGAYSGPSGNNTDLIVGEKLTGVDSGAVAVVVEKPNTVAVGVVPLNELTFNDGETVTSEQSGVTALVGASTKGDKNLTDQYLLFTNSKPTYYDYSFIQRKRGFEEPSNRLKIVFKNFFVSADDDGDFYSASSYPEIHRKLIPLNVEMSEEDRVLDSDLVDIRPRVSAYDTSSTKSPFDFAARSFAGSGDSVPDPFVPDESLIVSYDYYQPRQDRVFLDKDGTFRYLKGVPADDPSYPPTIADAIEIAKVDLPAYVYSMDDVSIQRTEYKRFTMADIAELEKRIENVEYYTQLSLLENDTANMQITDANGLNRYKSGFFVDSFKSHDAHSITHPDFSASIDANEGYCRPGHYTTAVDLVIGSQSLIGIGTTADPTIDTSTITDIDGQNVRKTGELITLDYTETELIKQVYASRVENVNPFLIVYYAGDMKLNPDSDVWVDTKFLDANVIEQTEAYDAVVGALGINEQTGLSEINWGSWETYWTGEKAGKIKTTETVKNLGKIHPSKLPKGTKLATKHVANGHMTRKLNGRWVGKGKGVILNAKLITTQQVQEITTTTKQSKKGVQYKVTPTVQKTSLGEKIVSTDLIPFMRSRNIDVTTTRMKPRTQFYAFFDGVDMTKFLTPKLLEIEMVSGVFEVGETVISAPSKVFTGGKSIKDGFTFRVAAPNHKEGPYNAPTKKYALNPYNQDAGIPDAYSTSSTLLNIDTHSMQEEASGEFSGFAKKSSFLKGKTSGAIARITEVRFISDGLGFVRGTFFLPEPNKKSNPKFEVGTKTLKLSTSQVDSKVAGTVTGSAEANFYAQGTLETKQEDIISTKVPKIEHLTHEEKRVLQNKITKKIGGEKKQVTGVQYYDPLAQTFIVEETTGVYITSVEVYMRDKDTEIPLTMQVRTVETGLPTSKILPYSVVNLDPDEVNVSEDASIPTKFTFDSPVFLTGGEEYALVLVTPSENYTCWISRMGEVDISTANLPEEQQVLISQQPYLGSLFKSQNGTTWDPSQYEDMKFTIYKAAFNTAPGVARFYSPQLSAGNKQIINLSPNPIEILSRKATVGLGTTFATPAKFVPGVTITQDGNLTASAKLVATAGIASVGGDTFTIINAGVGYTPSAASLVYNDVNLPTLTGSGSGMVGNVTVNNGQVSAVTVTNGGKNFAAGDTVGVGTLGLGNGSGAILAVGIITSQNTLILDEIQGSFITGVGTMRFDNGTNVVAIGAGVTINSFDIDSTNDGLHFKVRHRAHGMHAFNNRVVIDGVDSDVPITTLTADYNSDSTADIQVVNSANFATFEGVGVGTTNHGYVRIGEEIIAYTGVANGSITGITTRGIDNTQSFDYGSGSEVSKYELGGVSLRRINKTHNMNSPAVTVPNAKDLDYYHLKVNMNDDGTDRADGTLPNRFFSRTKQTGGTDVTASQNIQFETVTPNINTVTPAATTVSARIRTVSATSIGGSEESFADQGFEDIDISGQNHLDTPRMIASKVNEVNQLDLLPGNKSMTVEINMTSDDPDLSPVIDLNRVSTILTTNRLNNPVSNFATDRRVKVTGDDPVAASYVSKMVVLDNPATQILLEFAAYRRASSDIRAFFKVVPEGSTEDSLEIPFELFPGNDNIDANGKVINFSNNSGLPDEKTTPSNGFELKDYAFNSYELPPFTKFQIKIDMVGTNQAEPPFIDQLRAISLA